MAGMIGADLASLESLAGRIDNTGAEIGNRMTDARGISERVVDAMRTAFDEAVRSINQTMDHLVTDVDAMRAETDAAEWTGNNREVFLGAVGDFKGAIDEVRARTVDAYENLRLAAEQVGTMVTEFEGELDVALTNAQTATTDMRGAVANQRQAVDDAMNNSLTYSG